MPTASTFRFQNLIVWKRAAKLANELDLIAERLDEFRRYRFAEQLRAAGLSIPNNIAEGSGSNSEKDFSRFLYIARKSAFECASMLMIFEMQGYVTPEEVARLVGELDETSRMLIKLANSLVKGS